MSEDWDGGGGLTGGAGPLGPAGWLAGWSAGKGVRNTQQQAYATAGMVLRLRQEGRWLLEGLQGGHVQADARRVDHGWW